jgi:hypothetical protein
VNRPFLEKIKGADGREWGPRERVVFLYLVWESGVGRYRLGWGA